MVRNPPIKMDRDAIMRSLLKGDKREHFLTRVEAKMEEDEAEFEGDVMFGAFAEACPDFAAEEALAGAFPAFGETGARAGAFPAFPFTLAFATTVFA